MHRGESRIVANLIEFHNAGEPFEMRVRILFRAGKGLEATVYVTRLKSQPHQPDVRQPRPARESLIETTLARLMREAPESRGAVRFAERRKQRCVAAVSSLLAPGNERLVIPTEKGQRPGKAGARAGVAGAHIELSLIQASSDFGAAGTHVHSRFARDKER